jgi:outer membrane protein OmpA-like peptidoglycan-associated protein/Tol biopolymer transport system component
MRYKGKHQTTKAIEAMEKAIAADKTYRQAYAILGEWYHQERRYAEAIKVFQQASANCKDGQKAFAKPLAKSYLYNYMPDNTLSTLNTIWADSNAEAASLKANAKFMQYAMANKLKDTIRNMGTRINSRYPDMFPIISADSSTIYFTRRVSGIDEDFFNAKIDTCGGWLYARNMGSPPNTLHQEAAQMISADGHYLFFMRCENRSKNGWDRGGCDLYMAYRGDSIWSVPQSFGATINTPAYEGMPCLSPDNRELYFVSDKDGGYGGLDIWVSKFENGLWQAPRNVGPEINTKGNETAPFIHIDNHTLYFASDGYAGLGGSDLFYTRRINDSTWEKAQNMGYPINTTANEISINISLDGKRAFLSSDRDSVEGNFDIYETRLAPHLQPVPVAVVKGVVYDSLSADRLNYASIYINDASTGEQLYHFTSNRGDGSFMITLPKGRSYTYNADRIAYLDVTNTIYVADSVIEMEHNIALLPQSYQPPILDSTIIKIYFPINSASLTESDKGMLYSAMEPWLDKKDILILVNGYTDNTGTPIINEQLSYMRAGLVAKELQTLGFAEEMIKHQGWGEADPVAPNDTEEGMRMNRRVEVIIRR